MGQLKISTGNSKLGGIPNLSLTPGVTCRTGAPCFKDGCYALKSHRMYSNVRDAWSANLALWQRDPIFFYRELQEFLLKVRPERFRWHVGGDIPERAYFRMMKVIAEQNEGTNFLAFTKRWDILRQPDFDQLPANLSVVLSIWPGEAYLELEGVAKAWLMEDERRPADLFTCPGGCADCSVCWDAVREGRSVGFNRH